MAQDIGDFQEAIFAFTRVIEITQTNVNVRVLNSLVRAAADPQGFTSERGACHQTARAVWCG